MAATKLKSSPSPRRVTGKEPELMADEARRILRAEMIRCGFSFKMLAKALAEQQGGRAHRVGSIFDEQGEPGAVFLRVFLRAARAMGVPFVEAIKLRCRPRVTQHGGATRVAVKT